MLGLTVPSHLTDHQVDSQLDRCRAGLDFSKLPANRKVAVSKDITALSNEICRLRQTGTSPLCTDSPDSLPASSQDIPGASHKLRLHTSADKTRGRFITTSEDIEVRIENDGRSLIYCSAACRLARSSSRRLPTAASSCPLSTPATAITAWPARPPPWPAVPVPRPGTAAHSAGESPGAARHIHCSLHAERLPGPVTSTSAVVWRPFTVWA